MTTKRFLCVSACMATVLAAALRAEVPPLVSVQGTLGRISAGVATNLTSASQVMALRFYSDTNQSVTLFGRTNVTVLLEQGKFLAELGNGAGLTNAVAGASYATLPDLLADAPGSSFSIGLRLAGFTTDLFPVMRLQSVPFALVAGDAKQATRTFEVLNGTAWLSRLVVQGETTLKGPVSFEAGSAPVFNGGVSVSGDIKVTGGNTAFQTLTVDQSASVSNAALNGVTVSGGAATINGDLTVDSGTSAFKGGASLSAGRSLNVAGNLSVSGTLSVDSLNANSLVVTAAYAPLSTAKLRGVFGDRACIASAVSSAPTTDSGWSNSFYQVTSSSGQGSSYGYWKAPANCLVVANYVVGRYGTGEQYVKPIALMSSPSTTYATISDTANCIARTYMRHDYGSCFAAQKGSICIFMRKGQYLCWYSYDYDNADTVYGSGFMREISVLYFSN